MSATPVPDLILLFIPFGFFLLIFVLIFGLAKYTFDKGGETISDYLAQEGVINPVVQGSWWKSGRDSYRYEVTFTDGVGREQRTTCLLTRYIWGPKTIYWELPSGNFAKAFGKEGSSWGKSAESSRSKEQIVTQLQTELDQLKQENQRLRDEANRRF